jgi:hypothetical protein
MSKDYYVKDIDGNPTEFVQSGPRHDDPTWQEKFRQHERDAEDAARYRWFREQPMERKVWIAEMSDEGHMLDHHIDKGMCGL